MDDELAKLLSQMGQNQGQGSGKGGGGGGGNANSDSIQGHAERLWKFLDNLAEKDPEEYQNFLKKQAEAAGMDGKTPFAPKEHPVLVVICSKQQANKQVALLVFDDKEEAAKRGSEEDAIPSGESTQQQKQKATQKSARLDSFPLSLYSSLYLSILKKVILFAQGKPLVRSTWVLS
jgi:hypothetical protein